ncbi:MAG: hypothetical protein DRP94_01880 [Candidatus Latescibacterota bacterium]|nr:MAG: hypothetical protein DRP94_01880 [Candidatus Latescibacterota bacterium]
MYYLIVHLYQERYWSDILLALAAEGITDAVVVDASRMEQALISELPIFAGFWADMSRRGRFAKVIMASVPDRASVYRMVEALRGEGVDLTDPSVGKILLLPAEEL